MRNQLDWLHAQMVILESQFNIGYMSRAEFDAEMAILKNLIKRAKAA